VREEQRQMTRRRIIVAARQVFEQRGYGAASIGDITKAAKINRATFYLHFTNKAAVFNEVYDAVRHDQSARYWELLGHALATGTLPALREWLDKTLAWWEDQAALLPAIHEAMAIDPDVAALWKYELDMLADELHEYLDRFPEEQREQRRLRVQLLMVQLDQLCFRVIVQKVFPLDRSTLVDLVTGLWADCLGLVETQP
jgi:AcrR family transcriptional regulator